jgi:rubrerythrin
MAMTGVVIHGRLMQLTTRIPKRRSSRTHRTEARRPSEAAETRDARRGGGPEDRALYSCMCGYAFKASVTTSVDCPHCGTEQAW